MGDGGVLILTGRLGKLPRWGPSAQTPGDEDGERSGWAGWTNPRQAWQSCRIAGQGRWTDPRQTQQGCRTAGQGRAGGRIPGRHNGVAG